MGWGVHDYPTPPETVEREPRCPCCLEECDTVYKDSYGEILGCENCITVVDAADVRECVDDG